MKNLAQKPRRENFAGAQHKNSSRAWFASLLWRAFPASSEREVARRAAPLLGVSERQVINWLRSENDAALSYVTAVMALAGYETVLKPIRGKVA